MSLRKAFTGLATIVAVVVGIAMAPSASAAVEGGGCRSQQPGINGAYVNVDGTLMDSCVWPLSGTGVLADVHWSTPYSIDPCGHIIDIFSKKWVKDLGCLGWTSGSSNGYFASWNMPIVSSQYALSVGYWGTVNGVYGYYGDVESPVFWNCNGC